MAVKKARIGRPVGSTAEYSYNARLMVRLGEDRLAALARWAARDGVSTASKAREILEAAIQAEGLRVKRIPGQE